MEIKRIPETGWQGKRLEDIMTSIMKKLNEVISEINSMRTTESPQTQPPSQPEPTTDSGT